MEILTGLNFCQSKTWHWLLTLILAEMSAALFGGLLTGAHFTFQPPRQRRYLSRGPYAECPYKSIFIFVSPNFDLRSNHSYFAWTVCLSSIVNVCKWCEIFSFESNCSSQSKLSQSLQGKENVTAHERHLWKIYVSKFRLNLKTGFSHFLWNAPFLLNKFRWYFMCPFCPLHQNYQKHSIGCWLAAPPSGFKQSNT